MGWEFLVRVLWDTSPLHELSVVKLPIELGMFYEVI